MGHQTLIHVNILTRLSGFSQNALKSSQLPGSHSKVSPDPGLLNHTLSVLEAGSRQALVTLKDSFTTVSYLKNKKNFINGERNQQGETSKFRFHAGV